MVSAMRTRWGSGDRVGKLGSVLLRELLVRAEMGQLPDQESIVDMLEKLEEILETTAEADKDRTLVVEEIPETIRRMADLLADVDEEHASELEEKDGRIKELEDEVEEAARDLVSMENERDDAIARRDLLVEERVVEALGALKSDYARQAGKMRSDAEVAQETAQREYEGRMNVAKQIADLEAEVVRLKGSRTDVESELLSRVAVARQRRQVKEPITISQKEVEAEKRLDGYEQCCEVYAGARGSGVFCVRNQGHAPPHRGSGRQWRDG